MKYTITIPVNVLNALLQFNVKSENCITQYFGIELTNDCISVACSSDYAVGICKVEHNIDNLPKDCKFRLTFSIDLFKEFKAKTGDIELSFSSEYDNDKINKLNITYNNNTIKQTEGVNYIDWRRRYFNHDIIENYYGLMPAKIYNQIDKYIRSLYGNNHKYKLAFKTLINSNTNTRLSKSIAGFVLDENNKIDDNFIFITGYFNMLENIDIDGALEWLK